PEHGGHRVAGPAAEVLRPAIARVARPPEAVAGVAAHEVAAIAADGETLGVRPADVRADPLVEPERGNSPAARAVAVAGRGHPAAGSRAVHEAEVVGLDRGPAATADGLPGRHCRVVLRRGPPGNGMESAVSGRGD